MVGKYPDRLRKILRSVILKDNRLKFNQSPMRHISLNTSEQMINHDLRECYVDSGYTDNPYG